MPTYNQDLSATSGNAPIKQVGIVDPLAQQQMAAQPAQQMTNIPPQQANTLGTAQPVFPQSVQQVAQGIHGQQQVPGTFGRSLDPMAANPLFKKCNKKY